MVSSQQRNMSYQEFKNKIVSIARLSPRDVDFTRTINELGYAIYIVYPNGTRRHVDVTSALIDANSMREQILSNIGSEVFINNLANRLINRYSYGLNTRSTPAPLTPGPVTPGPVTPTTVTPSRVRPSTVTAESTLPSLPQSPPQLPRQQATLNTFSIHNNQSSPQSVSEPALDNSFEQSNTTAPVSSTSSLIRNLNDAFSQPDGGNVNYNVHNKIKHKRINKNTKSKHKNTKSKHKNTKSKHKNTKSKRKNTKSKRKNTKSKRKNAKSKHNK